MGSVLRIRTLTAILSATFPRQHLIQTLKRNANSNFGAEAYGRTGGHILPRMRSFRTLCSKQKRLDAGKRVCWLHRTEDILSGAQQSSV